MQRLRDHGPVRPDDPPRRGAAAVEMALCAPLLALMVLGVVDMGRHVNTGLVVNAASREGARKAARHEVTTLTQVEDGVYDYLGDYFSRYSRTDIEAATTITVTDSSGNRLNASSKDVGDVPEGNPINVEVVFNYDTVRWLSAMSFLDGSTLETTTTMRRQ